MATLEDKLAKLADAVFELAKRFDAMEKEDKKVSKGSMQEWENGQKREELENARADSIPGQIMATKRLRDELDLKERRLSQAMREQGPLTDRERAEMAETQARHDSIQAHFGRQAPPPMYGESPRMYRIRLMDELKRYHPKLKDANFRNAGGMENLDVFERHLFDSAIREAKRPTIDLPEDGLRRVVRKDDTGREVAEYFGKRTFVQQFAAPTVLKATKIYREQDLALARMVNSMGRKH